MRVTPHAILAIAAMCAAAPGAAEAEWLSLRSAHHQVAGNVTAGELREVALRLEQFRELMAALNRTTIRDDSAPIVVLLFRDERSYRPFMPRVSGRTVPVGGMFVAGPGGRFITLNLESGPDAYHGIYHEYSHVLLQDVFGAAPVWFNEGLAEYYSTLEITGDGRRAVIGKPIERHVALLRGRRLPLAQLLRVNAASPEYTSDTPERAVLYAQSWAVVHHALHDQPRRRDQLIDLALALARGTPAERAVQDAYGMSVADLDRAVQAYVRRETYQATSFELNDAITTRVPEVVGPVDDAELEAWLGGVQANIGRQDEAAARLERALAAQPDLGGAHATLGAIRLRQGRTSEARAHFDAARRLGAPPQASYSIQLSDRDSRRLLARAFLGAGNYAGVRDLLSPIVRENPADHEAALDLAEALIHLEDGAGARTALEPVLAAPATDQQQARARALLARAAASPPRAAVPERAPQREAPADSTNPPTAPSTSGMRLSLRALREGERQIHGTFLRIDCSAAGIVLVFATPRGEVRASARRLSDVDFVTFRSQTPASVSCGAQPGVPALLTWRTSGATAVAVELLPDGYVP